MSAKLVSIISVFVNFLLALSKIVLGFFTNSIAILADGIHSLLDTVSSVVSFVGIVMSSKPADNSYPYGREKYDSIATFVIVLLLFLSAGWIMYEALRSLFFGETTAVFSWWAISLVVISIVVNELMARMKYYFGNKDSSLALIADGEHSRADAISSVAVLVGLFFISWIPSVDGILALLVGLYIMYEAYGLGKEAVDCLVDKANPELEEKIKNILKNNNLYFLDIKTRKIGQSNFAEINLVCDDNKKIDEVTKITKNLENKLLDSIEELSQLSISIGSSELVQVTTKSRFGGRYHGEGKKMGNGPGGKCVCMDCNISLYHKRGIPCSQMKCPKCGEPLTREIN